MCCGMFVARWGSPPHSPTAAALLNRDGERSQGPAKLSAQITWFMSFAGIAAAVTRCSMPRSRKTSIVRWSTMCARGEFANPG